VVASYVRSCPSVAPSLPFFSAREAPPPPRPPPPLLPAAASHASLRRRPPRNKNTTTNQRKTKQATAEVDGLSGTFLYSRGSIFDPHVYAGPALTRFLSLLLGMCRTFPTANDVHWVSFQSYGSGGMATHLSGLRAAGAFPPGTLLGIESSSRWSRNEADEVDREEDALTADQALVSLRRVGPPDAQFVRGANGVFNTQEAFLVNSARVAGKSGGRVRVRVTRGAMVRDA
jgi:hypothetical protein